MKMDESKYIIYYYILKFIFQVLQEGIRKFHIWLKSSQIFVEFSIIR